MSCPLLHKRCEFAVRQGYYAGKNLLPSATLLSGFLRQSLTKGLYSSNNYDLYRSGRSAETSTIRGYVIPCCHCRSVPTTIPTSRRLVLQLLLAHCQSVLISSDMSQHELYVDKTCSNKLQLCASVPISALPR